MDPIKVDFTKKGTSKKDVIIPPEKAALKIIISLIGALVVAAVTYYIMLPPMNVKATEMYLYFAIVVGSYIALLAITSGLLSKAEYTPYVKRQSLIPGIIIGLICLVVAVGFVISSIVFRAGAFSKILPVDENGDFGKEIEMQNDETFKQIPRLDSISADAVAQKALSSLGDKGLVSQFNLFPTSTQINYKGAPVRVVPLQYANLIKWFTNRTRGLPGYVVVDMAKETYEYKEAPGGGIYYSPSEHFGRLLKRHLRFEYPSYMFSEPSFEIDDDGNPFWVCARLDKTIGLFGGTDVLGIVMVDADDRDGKCTYYSIDEIRKNADLQWLDRIYSSDLLLEQYNYYSRYQNGFWNSILGQKDVRVATEGHSYIAKDDDVFLYTGVTSITSDQAITGFILINQRTKDSTFYRVDGAKEESAREAAQGRVKDLGYTATFPLLINIGGQPTYFMSLLDATNIRQQYAMVNVRDYNKISSNGKSVSECMEAYIEEMRSNGIDVNDINVKDPTEEPEPGKELKTLEGTIREIRSAVINGTTRYYFLLDSAAGYFTATAAESELTILLKTGERVKISYMGELKDITAASEIERLPAVTPGTK